MKIRLLFLLLFLPLFSRAESGYGSGIDIEPPRSSMLIRHDGKMTVLYATHRQQIAVFNIDNPEKPELLRTYRTGFFPQGLALNKDNTRLFAVDGRYLTVLDSSAPEKLKLRARYLVSTDPAKGPVDVCSYGDNTYLACRSDGIRYSAIRNLAQVNGAGSGWARAVMVRQDGTVAGTYADRFRETEIPVGTPGKARQFADGNIYIANGFAGLAVIGKDKKFYGTKDLNLFSCYGGRVYDVAPGWTQDTVLLAAGEAGIIAADVRDLNRIRLIANIYPWKNVTGLIRHGKYLFVSDTAENGGGLAVFDIREPERMKQTGSFVFPVEK